MILGGTIHHRVETTSLLEEEEEEGEGEGDTDHQGELVSSQFSAFFLIYTSMMHDKRLGDVHTHTQTYTHTHGEYYNHPVVRTHEPDIMII